MSRRKQTKPQHLHSDSEGEEDKTPKDGKVTDGCEPQPSGPSASPGPGLVAASPHQGDTQTAEKQEGGDSPSKQDVASESSDPHNDTAASRSNAAEISRPPKKRGRPLSLSSGAQKHLPNFSKSHSAIATALVLAAASPRRQSSRLHPPPAGAGFLGESGGKKMSHRTCEYCGVVKPTPAALQRHVRKHTGEKPFVCKVCQKAYKAKRSLHCHQITNHPELLDGTPNIASTSDLDPAAASATVSPSTSHLLRETLETRRMARKSGVPDTSTTVPEFVKSLMARSTNGHSDEKVSAKPSGDTSSSPSAHSDHAKASCAADAMQDLSVNVSTLTSSLDDADAGGEETGGDLAKRSCPHCQKVFIKPSDLKRHLMVHTGERPFVCHYCNKGFKQPGSLNYHMKATHNLDIPLSQGLEERYLRLKTRSAMRNLAAMEGWTPRLEQEGGNGKSRCSPALPSALPSASCTDAEVRPESTEPEGEADHSVPPPPPVPQSLASCSSHSPDFKQGLQRQTSVASEGSWSEDRGPGPNVIDVELPQFAPLDGSAGDAAPLPPRKVQMAVKKETVLFTRLEGACSSTGQEMQVFRCCLCDKVCASLFYAFSHLALHLESARTPGFECRLCNRVFKSQLEMADHFWRKHNVTLNDLDLQNNNHNLFTSFNSKRDEDGMQESDALEESEMKEEEHLDDHNNNNGNHINKEYTSADSIREKSAPHASQITPGGDATNASDLPFPTSPQPQSNLEDSCVKFTDGLEPSEPPQYPTKGTHRCPKCSKCYMTQFLLDRHVAFHTRQSLIEAAMKSGAKVNGAQKDLLLQPPPVLPQDLEMFLRLKELSTAQDSEQGKESGESGEQKQVDDGNEPSLSHKGLSEEDLQNGLLDTKALLEKEGIQEDVTVVMPSDPDLDEEGASPPEPEVRSEIEDAEMAESSEIRCAPKRQLIPYRKETVVTKSRRKSSLPTKFRSAAREPENSPLLPASSSSQQHPSEQQPQESTASGHTEQQELSSTSRSCSNSPKRLSESPAERSSESPSETDQINKEFQREMLRAQQSSYLQTLHAAFGNVPSALLGSTFPGNGFPPASSLAMAAAGYLRPFSALPGRSPFSLHGSASVSNSNPPSKARSQSPPSPASGNEEDQAEDLSLSSGSATSPPSSASASLPSASALPGNPEKLVGYPRVLWEAPLRSRGEEESPSPPPLSTSMANGKLFNPVWHTLSSEDLSNSSTTDGRKVTSLSRTHSRLYVVNQPVDRERICKPTVLPDGRTVFRCIFCHKDFLSYSDINRHMDFHEDIRPYKCNFCDYYARTNSQLKVHMMRHQGIREYCCRLCNYKGVTQSDLNRHMKSQIHLLKSRNECTKCGEGFVTTKNLEKHLSAGCDGTHKMDVKESS